ncbi:MAG: apolipoprotein N-acyltransferase [Candidatus Binatia bacterium]
MSTGSGGLLIAAQPPYSFALVAWVALVPLLIALRGKRAGQRLLLGLLCGTVWAWGLVGIWLLPAAEQQLPVAAGTAFILTLAAVEVFGGFYLAAFACWCRPVAGRPALPAVLALPAGWVTLELVRTYALGGAPWCLLGHSQYARTVLIQSADVAGVYGLSFALVAVNVAVAHAFVGALRRSRRPSVLAELVGVAVMLLALLGYGEWRLHVAPSPAGGVAVQAVHSRWSNSGRPAPEQLLARLIELTEVQAPAGARLLIWPENSLRLYVQETPEAVRQLGRLLRHRQQYLLAGGPWYQQGATGYRYYNSAFLFTPAGTVVARYDKRLLVPLAESRFGGLPVVERPFRSGRAWTPLTLGRTGSHANPRAAVRLGVLICYESIFPQPARELVRAGATVLVNISNDELLGAGAAQQAAMAVFRAVENRVPLIRVANDGPTYAVDAFGRTVAAATAGSGSLLAAVPGPSGRSFYSRWGNIFSWGCLLLVLWNLAVLVAGRTHVRGQVRI